MNDLALKRPWQHSPAALWLRDRLLVLDPALLAIVGALALVGLVTLYSAGNDFPWRFTDQLRNWRCWSPSRWPGSRSRAPPAGSTSGSRGSSPRR